MCVPAAATLAFALTAAAQSQDASLYKEALTREAALREDLAAVDDGDDAEPLYERIRVMIGAYEDIALLFPESEYGDDALWQGGVLAADLFERTADARDRETALELLQTVAERFPSSPLLPKVPAQLARLRTVPRGDVRVASAPPAPAAPPPPAATTTRPPVPAALPAPAPTTTRLPAPAVPPAPEVTTTRPPTPEVTTTRPTVPAAPPTAPAATTRPPAPVARPPARPRPTPSAGAPATAAVLRRISNELLPEVVRITLYLEREVSFADERLVTPPRVFVDLENVAASRTVQNATIALGDRIVRRLRVVPQPRGGTRVAIDLIATVDYSIYALYNPFRLVIDFERRGPRSSAATASAGRRANAAATR